VCASYKGIEVPDNDAERINALARYEILDSDPEIDYDDITELAARLTGCQVSYIGFFDDKRLWLKSKYGLPPTLTERPRELTLCAPTICQTDLVMIPDMSQNPRYADLPTVKNPPHAKFYCAMPLINPDGFALGTLCVWDSEAKELDPEGQQLIRRLARQILTNLELRRRIIELHQKQEDLLAAAETARSAIEHKERLIRELFPDPIANRVLADEPVETRFYASASVLFVDFEGFTTIAESLEPRVLIEQLNDYFAMFDQIVESHGLEKIKTVGDAYLAVAGAPRESRDHALRATRAALEINRAMDKVNAERKKLALQEWPIRIGIHSGSLIAGVVGGKRTTYDIWGDGVNVAKRMQENCEPGQINISEATVGLVSNAFETQARGFVEAKNKGSVRMYYVLGPAYD
jgi:class 3 adenylate cyclase